MRKPSREFAVGITRRDFLGATLLGTGAALLGSPCPASVAGLGAEWTGYGGVGDYQLSNGNTASVVQAAHKIRDHAYDDDLRDVIDTHEVYDVVVVGAGFSGLAATYEFLKLRPHGRVLLIDNHPIFGGFAKANEFLVDGYRVAGPQASVDFVPPRALGVDNDDFYWSELGLPEQFEFAPYSEGLSVKVPKAVSAGIYWAEANATIGYFFNKGLVEGEWIKNIWDDDLKRAPWPKKFKSDLITLRDRKLKWDTSVSEPTWLDRMSYAQFVTEVIGLSPDALAYFTPITDVIGSPQVSAYAARDVLLPGVSDYAGRSPLGGAADLYMSFPGGNSALLRHFVKAVLPEAIEGPRIFDAILNGRVRLSALDRSESACRMRLDSTVVRAEHDNNEPSRSDGVNVTYEKAGRLYRVKGRGVVLGIGSWVTKHIVKSLPPAYRSALDKFLYGPILIVNVALRNWRFLDRLGISTARWFDGFGFYCSIRRPMVVGGHHAPFHPDKPIVLTFYVPIQRPELPLAAQGPAARTELYSTSYADYERLVVAQMQAMFGAGGFDARRDIAGIVLNRWGHARLSPPPGFFFGDAGGPSPLKVLEQPLGRIAFGSSELSGGQTWPAAVVEARRAIGQILEKI